METGTVKGAAGFMSNSAFAARPMKFSYILTLFEMVVKIYRYIVRTPCKPLHGDIY